VEIKVEKVDVFGDGVQAFRITADTTETAQSPAAHDRPQLTENAKRLGAELRQQLERDLDSRW
jgi:hypothetical protein